VAEQLSVPSLLPNFAVVLAGSAAAAVISILFLPWPIALASTVLASLMIYGADVDARTLLLPNVITYGATIIGLAAAPLLASFDPWTDLGAAALRAAGTFLTFALLRKAYARLRGREGLGFGDVKLAAAIGAWLPFETIPYCLGLATTAALLTVVLRWREHSSGTLKLPFGAFLCPATWLVFFLSCLSR
jgi:leader peptidase (prepilin peptidase)/N-methyltransferase